MKSKENAANLGEISGTKNDFDHNHKLAKYVTELTKRVEALESRVQFLEPYPYNARRGFLSLGGSAPKKKGRKPGIEKEDLLRLRDALTTWLEQDWPELSVGIRRSKSGKAVVEALKSTNGYGHYPFTPDINQNADKYERETWEFLQSGKYRGSPRNFANAMAGLPNVSWRTSWNICSANPCTRPILPPAIRDHIRRKFPNRFRELLKAKTEEDVKRILRKSHSKDETWTWFKKNPSKVLESLGAGRPH